MLSEQKSWRKSYVEMESLSPHFISSKDFLKDFLPQAITIFICSSSRNLCGNFMWKSIQTDQHRPDLFPLKISSKISSEAIKYIHAEGNKINNAAGSCGVSKLSDKFAFMRGDYSNSTKIVAQRFLSFSA